MDQPSTSLEQNVDLSKLSQKDKQELQQFIVNESQKARIQQCESFPLSYCPLPSLSSSCLVTARQPSLRLRRRRLDSASRCILVDDVLTVLFG